MSLWHTELEIALWALEDLPLESTGLTTVISNLLSQAFVYHQCRIGFVEDRYSRMVTLLHSWIELPDGWCIDLTLRKWLDDDDDIPLPDDILLKDVLLPYISWIADMAGFFFFFLLT